MSLATVDVEPIRSARRAAVGADSPELAVHLAMRTGDTVAMAETCGGEMCGGETCAVQHIEPSGGAESQPDPAEDPPQRTAWSRQGWKSTAAFTIGRPPRAPRAI
jgi:hypothetical protein